jgi:hypothetical protein
MVWQEPLTKLAPRFALSDVGLRKACVRNNIPLPARGHWQKVAQGRTPNPAPLPKPAEDWGVDFAMPVEPSPAASPLMENVYAPLISAEESPDNRIVVASDLGAPHAMTRAAQKAFKRARPDNYGALVCEDPDVFRVRVPPASVDRALLIIDALAKAITARGLTIKPGDGGHYSKSAGVVVEGHIERLTIEETSSRQTHRLTEAEKVQMRSRGYSAAPLYDFKPSGVLTIKVEGVWRDSTFQSTWRDSARQRVEDRLNEVLIGLYRAAHASAIYRAREAVRQSRVDAENARRAALRVEREAEADFLKTLEEEAASWKRAERLRTYIAAVEARGRGCDGGAPAETQAWLAQARRHADRIDPMTSSPVCALDYDERDLRPLYGWEMADD